MQILAANVTKLGDKVYRYLEDHSSEYHAIMVGEHRWASKGLQTIATAWLRWA